MERGAKAASRGRPSGQAGVDDFVEGARRASDPTGNAALHLVAGVVVPEGAASRFRLGDAKVTGFKGAFRDTPRLQIGGAITKRSEAVFKYRSICRFYHATSPDPHETANYADFVLLKA